MSSESKYGNRFNPVELSVDEAGGYIQRVPTCMFPALFMEFQSSAQTASVLYWLVQKALNLTYLSNKEEIQAVKIASTELGKKLGITQQRASKCLAKLIKDKWITRTSSKGSTGVYIVNFDKVRKSIISYYKKFGD